MSFQKKNIKNVCSFYASEWHLSVMLLPYITKKIENAEKVQTIFNINMEENVNELVSKWSVNENIKREILDINWNISSIESKEQIETFIGEILENKNNTTIILNGENDKVEEKNIILNKILNKNLEKIKEYNIQITIISCFKALELKNKINAIYNRYDCSLNTAGEHKIEEIFNIYKKVISS